MNTHGPCPKCGNAERLTVPGAHGARGGIPTTSFAISNIGPTRYVCTQCGFVEEYVEPGPDLDKLVQHYRDGR